MSYVVTKTPLFLPQHILDLYKEEYFIIHDTNNPSDCDVSSEDEDSNINIRIPVYTEITLANVETIRCHPNYGGSGPIYDFVLVPRLLFVAPDKTQVSRKNMNKKKKATTTNPNKSHLADLYPNHEPCRVLSMFIDPDDDFSKAFVHVYQDRSQWNIDNDSVILESWTLKHRFRNITLIMTGNYIRTRKDMRGKQPKEVARTLFIFAIHCSELYLFQASGVTNGLYRIQMCSTTTI
jgi:hypothetical protein